MRSATPKTYILKRHAYTPLCSHSIRRRSPIQIIREAAGLSRPELAKRAGIAWSTLYLLEDNLIDPRLSTLIKIASALDVKPGQLIPDGKTSDENAQTGFRKAARSEDPNPRSGTAAG